ncbi:MAG: hypothetical protein A2607_01345 [Candidatus Vogelbacteria bacterium RIFOXYD1_FULL_42_15]|uniref:Thioredoxin domain-containing protein n=1 Tax=Candidatus Vogelbacteria bacterium RIFOXYD1_FULL_42_15 TaxID=1802437 RepID=A0A1G2QEA1_9BACT|nr:MAG: hypothetical protein A2607_01345 [Candidatus Vogelbacteria bacterium RIFOXYD1_FULL_42_15]
MDDFNHENITRYEQRQQAKAEKKQAEKKRQISRRLIRFSLWAGALILVALTIWQVDRLVSKRDGIQNGVATSSSQILSIKNDDWIKGSATAPLILIDYSDFECPACAQYSVLLEKLKTDYGDKLAIVFRHYPWFFHPQAMNSALASEAAGQQGKFWEMHDLLFARQDLWTKKTGQEVFVSYAIELGLDIEKFRQNLSDSKLKERVEKQLAEGKSLGIEYTPAFAFNGKIITNPRSYEEFRQIFDQALASR